MQQLCRSSCWCRYASFLCKSKEIFSWRCLQSTTNFVFFFSLETDGRNVIILNRTELLLRAWQGTFMRTDPSLGRNLTSLSAALCKRLLAIYPRFLKPVKIENLPICTSVEQKAGQNHNKLWNKTFENTTGCKYLGMALTNLNCVHEEITSIMNSVNAHYSSVQNLLFWSSVSKNVNIKIYRNIILPVVLYECQTWPFTQIEEHRLRVVVNRVLRKIPGHKRNKVAGDWRRLHD